MEIQDQDRDSFAWQLHYLNEKGKLGTEEPLYVCVYDVSQQYGGPEEGGWWWDHFECIEVIPCAGAVNAKEIALRAVKKHSNEGKPDYTSVLSEGRTTVIIERQPAESETRERPHYE